MYIKPEIKHKQGVLLVAAGTAFQKSAHMFQHSICYSFCYAVSFVLVLCLLKKKGSYSWHLVHVGTIN